MLYAAVFVGMVVLDFAWAFYTLALTRHQSIRAALYAGAWMAAQGFVTVGYVADRWLLLPAIFGAIIGTFVASKLLKV